MRQIELLRSLKLTLELSLSHQPSPHAKQFQEEIIKTKTYKNKKKIKRKLGHEINTAINIHSPASIESITA